MWILKNTITLEKIWYEHHGSVRVIAGVDFEPFCTSSLENLEYIHARHFLKHCLCLLILIGQKVSAFFQEHLKLMRLLFRDDFQAELMSPRQ